MTITRETRLGDKQLVECVKCRDCGAEKVLPTSRVELWLKTHEHWRCGHFHDAEGTRHICGKLEAHKGNHESVAGFIWRPEDR